MYKFLSSIREFSVAVKIIIFLALFLFGGPLFIVFLILVIKSSDTDPKKYKEEINEFCNFYDVLRPLVKDSNTNTNTIGFGPYICEYNKKICYLSKSISIHAKNIPDSITYTYPDVEKRLIESEWYYQLRIKKKYSKTAKITIINAINAYILKNYPDDCLDFIKEIPMGISGVGVKKIIDMFGKE